MNDLFACRGPVGLNPATSEWEAAAAGAAIDGNFLDNRALHPLAPRADSPEGTPGQLFGDVWEWTRSAYAPYPRYAPAGGAVGEYNGKFMCNQYVLRGGSCATPRSHIRACDRRYTKGLVVLQRGLVDKRSPR